MSDYQPISCIDHERLEFAVLKQQWLKVEVLKGEQAGNWHLLPLDVYTLKGAEWLKARDQDGLSMVIRLDWIADIREAG